MKSIAKVKARMPADLPKQLLDRLTPYAVAAGAALAVAATPANAEVVYHSTDVALRAGMSVRIQDVPVVTFSSTWGDHVRVLGAKFASGGAAQSGRVGTGPGDHFYAAKLASGASIGPNIMVDNAPIEINAGFYSSHFSGPQAFSWGPWEVSPTPGYLGFRFTLRGETHYGWMRLTISRSPFAVFHHNGANYVFTATLTGFAYETKANKPILAGDETGAMAGKSKPQPGLGFLALGSAAIPIWRKQ